MSIKHEDLDLGFRLFEGMQKDNLGYIYRGLFTQEITDSIISFTESNLKSQGESPKVRKRIFSIMVECLQNVTRHQMKQKELIGNDVDFDNSGLCIIQQKKNYYYITTGNIVQNTIIPKLKKQLDTINSFDKDGLKAYYKQILDDGTISDKGGAGLGLIEMARKSENKLAYDFESVSDSLSYFYLHTAISKSPDDEQNDGEIDINNIKDLHKIVNGENIMLTFNGVLNQECLINLLQIIDKQELISEKKRKRMFNIMVEMSQNIVKHGAKRNDEVGGNPGIFFISEKDNKYILSTGNYIINSNVEELKEKLEHVNSLDADELDSFYSDRLLNFEIDNCKEAGLGVIDLRIKSGDLLKFNFYHIDDNISFFTLQISL